MGQTETIFIASDHAGFSLKVAALSTLKKEFPEWHFEDLGPSSEASVDYPDFAKLLGVSVAKENAKGVLICGSGLGMCISANKVAGVRATSAWDTTSARLARQHNDANVVCIGARLLGQETAIDAIRTFLKTPFEGGRHAARVEKIRLLEKAT